MKSLSFDNMAELYDETRIFDINCLNSALEYIVDRFPPERFRDVFYPGIGTGRIAIPLAERGYRITGVDISENMLSSLKKQLEQSKRHLNISFRKADVTRLPYKANSFDAIITVHLFYFIRDWEKAVDEIVRVVRNEGPFILMHTGTGMEIPFLNTRYKELCSEQGFKIPDFGVKSNKEVIDYLENLGYNAQWIRDRWKWTSHIRLDKALDYVRSRAYSFTTCTPDDIHSKVVNGLESELERDFGSLTYKVEIPNQIYLVIVSR